MFKTLFCIVSTVCVASEQSVVEGVIAEAKQIVNKEGEHGAELGALIARSCDLKTIARDILGKDHEGKIGEFGEILKNVYTKRYGTQEKIKIFKESTYIVVSASGGTVVTMFKNRENEQETEVVWMISGDQIVDIQIAGVSMVQSEKAQFFEVYQQKGRNIDAVLAHYKEYFQK